MLDHKFKKKFGQNFLQDKNIISKIANVCDTKSDDLIIEIGPGGGALTKELVEKSQVLAYEIDNDLKENLTNIFVDKNVDFIFDDFLNRDINIDLKKYNYKNLYVIANLPYYITTPIIQKIIDSNLLFNSITIMIQKEVGDRFSAKPKTKDYNSLTVYLNYYFEIKKEFIVSRNAFIPKPNVDSIVVTLKRKKELLYLKDENLFNKLLKDAFKFKRKTIKNNLKDYDLNKIEEILKKYNFNLTSRAEELPLLVFVDITNNLK
jgi:16S rRNA (adenine1518-N6/adenine1519-N6)-dimethyltransferase